MNINELPFMDKDKLTVLLKARQFYVYTVPFTALAAGASQSQNFTVQQDGGFLWQAGAYYADIAGAAQSDSSRVIPLVTVNIQETSSGLVLMSNPTPISTLFGAQGVPFVLPMPRFFQPTAQVTLSVTSLDAAATYANFKLIFIGTKFTA